MKFRPQYVFVDGAWEQGLEIELADGVITAVRATSLRSQPSLLSPAFVNAHSHLEYRGMLGKLESTEYWRWIREITARKVRESIEEVALACQVAASENLEAGVAFIAEHTDRPHSAAAMEQIGLKGVLFQEVITILESPAEKLEWVRVKASVQREFVAEVYLSPHAPHTVDEETLRGFSGAKRLSIHVAESEHETSFFRDGSGPIAEFYAQYGLPSRKCGLTVAQYLASIGLARSGFQWVHCCDFEDGDLQILAESMTSVAHCPRSNFALGCPIAKVRRMLDLQIPVGLGLDSAASSGPIDMLAEMRAALRASFEVGEPLSQAEVWNLATTGGASSLGLSDWEIKVGSRVPLISICASDPAILMEEDSCPSIQFMTAEPNSTI